MSNNHKPNQEPHKMPTVGLDESPLSAYAKAINSIKEKKRTTGYVPMGYTPQLLRFLTNIENLRSYVAYDNLRKDMYIKHKVSASVMLKLPYALNNPIAILKSSGKAKQQGFVFVTDLQEDSKPLIIAVNRETLPNQHITIEIKSAYGKELSGFQNMLNFDILCWDYSKTERFEKLYSGILDLPKYLYPTADFGQNKRLSLNTDSHSPLHCGYDYYYQHESLYVDYDKTERYLSQYFSDMSVNPDLYRDAKQVKAAREWTQRYAPMTRKEAFTAIMSVYAEFHTDEQILNDIADQVVQPHLSNLYQQGKTVVGDDLNALHQNLQEKEQQADKGVQAAPKTPLNDKDDMDGRE